MPGMTKAVTGRLGTGMMVLGRVFFDAGYAGGDKIFCNGVPDPPYVELPVPAQRLLLDSTMRGNLTLFLYLAARFWIKFPSCNDW